MSSSNVFILMYLHSSNPFDCIQSLFFLEKLLKASYTKLYIVVFNAPHFFMLYFYDTLRRMVISMDMISTIQISKSTY